MKNKIVCKIAAVSALFLTSFISNAITLGVSVTPVLTTPVSDSFYGSIGGGALIGITTELNSFIESGIDAGINAFPTTASSLSLPTAYYAGLSVESFFYPLSQLRISAGGAGGVYSLHYELTGSNASDNPEENKKSYQDLYWRLYAEAGYRFSPSLSLNLHAGYIYMHNIAAEKPSFQGITAGISLNMAFSSGQDEGDIEITPEKMEPVFPVLRGLYKENPIGTITLTNKESAEIRDVTIHFKAANYTSTALECIKVPFLNRGESVPFFLYADFSKTIQNFTEKGKIPGEIIISYNLLGESRSVSRPVTINVNSRNTLRWTDKYQIASFVSPNAPEVLDYSKYMVGVARNNLRTGLNKKMQFAMYLFEGLKVGGINLSNDDITPYTEFHQDNSLTDYIQYPFQTLAYHSGDMDDLGLLFAAVLESVGIKAALIPLKNDFIVAYGLDMTPRKARDHFEGLDKLLTIDNQIWMPLSISVLREGFINSWFHGINNISAALAEGEDIEVIMLNQAWTVYPPTGIRGTEAQFQKPSEELVVRSVETDLMRYINSEFGPKIRQLRERLESRGGNERTYNRLGLLYVRAGLFDQARAEYAKSAEMGSLTAKINLGNIALVLKDYKTAERWYQEVLRESPTDQAANSGLDRVRAELSDE